MSLFGFQLYVYMIILIVGTVQSIPIRRVARASSSAAHSADSTVKMSNSTLQYLTRTSTNSTGLVSLWLEANSLASESLLKTEVRAS